MRYGFLIVTLVGLAGCMAATTATPPSPASSKAPGTKPSASSSPAMVKASSSPAMVKASSSPAMVEPTSTPTVVSASSTPTVVSGAEPPDPEAILAAYKTDAYVLINQAGIAGTGPHTAGKPLFIYVDKAHAALYTKAVKGPMPAGTSIVKVSAEGEDKLVAIMVKLPAGTDPTAADWFFWERIGTSVPFDGNARKGGGLCYSCHQGAPAEADALLGTAVFGK